MPAPISVSNNVFRIFLGICFLILLSVATISVINPEEKRKAREDFSLEQKVTNIAKSLNSFYKLKGRTPWSDDVGSKSPSPGLYWTLASAPEIGFCSEKGCSNDGEVNLATATVSGTIKSDNLDTIYVGRGPAPKDSIFVCFLPQSQEYRQKTGVLSRVDIKASKYPTPELESCPDRVSWEDIDVCYLCVSN